MILVYNDHTEGDPHPVRVGDEIDSPDGMLKIIEILSPGRAGTVGRVFCQPFGLPNKVLLPNHLLKAHWIAEPTTSCIAALNEAFAELAAAQQKYHAALLRQHNAFSEAWNKHQAGG